METGRILMGTAPFLDPTDGAYFGYGHNACLVGNDKDGWKYYSKDGPFKGDVSLPFSTLNNFYESDRGKVIQDRYDGGYRIATTREQDAAMKAYGDENYDKDYSLTEAVRFKRSGYDPDDEYSDLVFESQNCADLTADIARAGNINMGKPKIWFITHPNAQYRDTVGRIKGTPIAI